MIRKALPSEIQHCVNLLYMASEKELKYIFGDEASVKKILTGLVEKPDNVFSRDFIWLDEDDRTGDIRGLISLIKGKSVPGLNFNMVFQISSILKVIGMGGLWHVIREGLRISGLQPKVENDEFYVAALAVYPEYRGKHLASGMLDFASDYCQVVHYDKLCLAVEMGNDKAFAFYKKHGFQVADTRRLPQDLRKHGLTGHYKLAKSVRTSG